MRKERAKSLNESCIEDIRNRAREAVVSGLGVLNICGVSSSSFVCLLLMLFSCFCFVLIYFVLEPPEGIDDDKDDSTSLMDFPIPNPPSPVF